MVNAQRTQFSKMLQTILNLISCRSLVPPLPPLPRATINEERVEFAHLRQNECIIAYFCVYIISFVAKRSALNSLTRPSTFSMRCMLSTTLSSAMCLWVCVRVCLLACSPATVHGIAGNGTDVEPKPMAKL